MTKRAVTTISIGILFILVASSIHFWHENKKIDALNNIQYIHNQGEAQGTTYSIIYQQPDGTDLHTKIDKLLHEFDMSCHTMEVSVPCGSDGFIPHCQYPGSARC